MRKTWQINGPFGEYQIIKSSDLKRGERYINESAAILTENLNEWLTDERCRSTLLEIYEENYGYMLPGTGNIYTKEVEYFIKYQLKMIFQNREFVLLPIHRLYVSGYREKDVETVSDSQQGSAADAQIAESTVVETPPIEVTNAVWDKKVARRGDVLKLSADVKNADDGTSGKMEIWEHDADDEHDFIKKIPAKVKDKKLEAEWEFEYHEDTDEAPTADEDEKGYNPPEYFFKAKIGDATAESDLLEFKDWIEITLEKEKLVWSEQNPMIPFEQEVQGDLPEKSNIDDESAQIGLLKDDDTESKDTEYDFIIILPDGQERKGKLDENGYAKEEDIPPGKCKVKFLNIVIDNMS